LSGDIDIGALQAVRMLAAAVGLVLRLEDPQGASTVCELTVRRWTTPCGRKSIDLCPERRAWLLGRVRLGRLVRDREDRLEQPLAELLVVAELLEELRVVLDQRVHDAS
jgi:hypothetical protein